MRHLKKLFLLPTLLIAGLALPGTASADLTKGEAQYGAHLTFSGLNNVLYTDCSVNAGTGNQSWNCYGLMDRKSPPGCRRTGYLTIYRPGGPGSPWYTSIPTYSACG